MRKITLLLILMLGGCANHPSAWRTVEVPNWQGMSIKPTEAHEKRTVKIKIVSPGELTGLAYFSGYVYGNPNFEENLKRGYFGLSVEENGDCVLYMLEPKNMDDNAFFSVLGHELYHCFAGKYHEGS